MPSPFNRASSRGDELPIAAMPIQAVLDALIQENYKVPIPAISRIAVLFPEQAVILVASRPLTESRAMLEWWTSAAQGTWNERILAKVAFMLLAKEPASPKGFCNQSWTKQYGFVASTVACSEVQLQVTVSAEGKPGLSGGGNICGGGAPQPVPGWPKVYSYLLLENDSADADKPALVELNGDRLTPLRYVSDGWSQFGCHTNVWLDPHRTWHEMIAYWIGVQPQDMTWHPQRSVGIRWEGKAEYQQQLAKLIDTERRAMEGTVVVLRKRGLLTDDEAASLTPRVVVTIDCQMKPCPLD